MQMTEAEAERQRAEKRARSEAKRLESMRNRGQYNKQQKEVIKNALLDVDKPSTAKKITFDSDDEGGVTVFKQPKATKLFDDDEEEMEEIVISNRHKGKNAAKLMERELRFNNDDRFRLDEKFADESDGEEDEDEDAKNLKAEKSAQMNILEQLLGKSIGSNKEEKKGKREGARPFTRFDPDNPDHVRWMNEHAPKPVEKPKEKNEREEKIKEESEIVEEEKRIVEGHFFDVNESFADELRKKLRGEEKGFSFLASIGRGSVKEEEEEEGEEGMEEEVKEAPQKKGSKQSFSHLVAKRTLLDDDVVSVNKDDPFGLLADPISLPFFIDGDNHLVRSITANFRRTQSEDVVKSTWTKSRESMIKIYKNQHKFAEKKKKVEKKGFTMEGHRFEKKPKKDEVQRKPE